MSRGWLVPAEECRRFASEKPLGTLDVARMLERSAWTVRWLARRHELPCTRLPNGHRVFKKGDVERLMQERADRRVAQVAALRPKKLGVPDQPRQLSLFVEGLRPAMAKAAPRLRLATRDGQSTEAWVLQAISFRESA